MVKGRGVVTDDFWRMVLGTEMAKMGMDGLVSVGVFLVGHQARSLVKQGWGC